MHASLNGKTLRASFFHAPVRGAVEHAAEALIDIDAAGGITRVVRQEDADYAAVQGAALAAGRLATLPAGQVLLPGFVDLHVHAPQFPQLGSALDVPLEEWLLRHTFPLEARYADTGFAARVYDRLVRTLLANGTTTALYFATIHQDATRILVDTCLRLGQRALVGKVAMDNAAQCPEYYRDTSPDAAISGTRALIDYVRAHPDNATRLVLPVVTPRFIPACTDATLHGLGALAREAGCHVQTHCSESDWEHGYVLDRHGMSDAASLDRFGLLGRHSVLAHGNFIDAADMDLLAQRQAGIAHCPLSNAYFANAVFPLRAALEKGLQVGLGTDISGGPSASLFSAARAAIMAARMLESGVNPALPPAQRGTRAARIDVATAFHLATAGGAAALDLKLGSFTPGLQFDAMQINPQAADGGIATFEATPSPTQLLDQIIHTTTRANIAAVWVAGRCLVGGVGGK